MNNYKLFFYPFGMGHFRTLQIIPNWRSNYISYFHLCFGALWFGRHRHVARNKKIKKTTYGANNMK